MLTNITRLIEMRLPSNSLQSVAAGNKSLGESTFKNRVQHVY